jgi:hypothetical protein
VFMTCSIFNATNIFDSACHNFSIKSYIIYIYKTDSTVGTNCFILCTGAYLENLENVNISCGFN